MTQMWIGRRPATPTPAVFANDYERPNAWRYRDYLVRSFNADKPYDRFIIEQLAGDELAPEDPEMLFATGFLRSGPWEHTGMSVAAVTRQLFLDDITQSVGVSFLAHSFRCAKCHDHKFDPVPTRDLLPYSSSPSPRCNSPTAKFLISRMKIFPALQR